MDAAVDAIAPGVHAGSTVIFETTLPVGDTRDPLRPALERASGLRVERTTLFVAFSPERLFSRRRARNLATYPKLVGGVGPASTDRAARFYASVLDAEVVAMSSAEAAEFSKLADTTYRDVNIALANEFAALRRPRSASTSRRSSPRRTASPTATSTSPASASAATASRSTRTSCSRAPGSRLVEAARERVNDGQVDRAVAALQRRRSAGSTAPGPRPRADVSRGRQGARVLAGAAADRPAPIAGARVSPSTRCSTADEVHGLGATPWRWGEPAPTFRAIVTQTGDPTLGRSTRWFPRSSGSSTGATPCASTRASSTSAIAGSGRPVPTRVRTIGQVLRRTTAS